MVEYHVPVAPGGVADIFDQLESNKNALQIKHFSVSQTTLDEVRKKKKKRDETQTESEGRTSVRFLSGWVDGSEGQKERDRRREGQRGGGRGERGPKKS